MPSSRLEVAKRAFVKVLLALAAKYQVATAVTRESAAHALLSAYKRLLLKVHPDKGGSAEDFKKLQDVKEKWDDQVPLPYQKLRVPKGTNRQDYFYVEEDMG